YALVIMKENCRDGFSQRLMSLWLKYFACPQKFYNEGGFDFFKLCFKHNILTFSAVKLVPPFENGRS
ncbi:MAG: hypothetical protein Q7S39_10560, partial [Ignavibacteria bacterium]|nr:hypothetical protein [Ignavibacteria bacterium]